MHSLRPVSTVSPFRLLIGLAEALIVTFPSILQPSAALSSADPHSLSSCCFPQRRSFKKVLLSVDISSISMSLAGFAARGTAVEGAYFRKEQEYALRKQLGKMVKDGQLPPSALLQPQNQLQLIEAASSKIAGASAPHQVAISDVPVTVLKGRPNGEYVYQHVKGKIPGNCRHLLYTHFR